MFRHIVLSCVLAFLVSVAHAQQSTPQPPDTPQPAQQAPAKGTVLFERHAAPVTDTPAETPAVAQPLPEQPAPASPSQSPVATAAPDITDAERSALTFTTYDLDARIGPLPAQLTMRALVTLRNDGATPLTHIALQISSQLTWQSATLVAEKRRTPLTIAQHLLDTDADHTGKARELVLTLPTPLAAGASLTLDTFYSGNVTQNSERLLRIGASHEQADAADWDAVTASSTALRGFGNVLWYPVAAPQLFLGEGAQLFDAIGATKLREATATIHLHLAIETIGDPPVAAYFCGRRQDLKPVADNTDVPTIVAPGIAVADFPATRLGFRTPSLFVLAHPEVRAGQLPTSVTGNAPADNSATANNFLMLAIESSDVISDTSNGASSSSSSSSDSAANSDATISTLAAAAENVSPLLQQWLGAEPLTALTLVDHPGQPFEDGPLLVAPLAALTGRHSEIALAHSLTHAWIETGQPWIDEGLAQFFALLWIERSEGRTAALAQFTALEQPLQLIEPAPVQNKSVEPSATPPAPLGQPLISATTEVYFRRKAAAVWWMLDGITGESPLQFALQQMRARGTTANTPRDEALVFEALLEKSSGKDLHWFFDDWVLHDRGLPDLTIEDVTPRDLPAAKGRSTGYLVAITVRNEGAAVADVPLIVHTAISTNESRLRIPAFSTVTTRIVVEAAPTEVVVNDGTTPEQITSTHSRTIEIHTH